ncbi:hypothetical protein KW843_15500 [Acidovorax sp. sif1233]|uniref:hypothetical protein n=1 Tax=unclassified Acidovorax TaxID=2684926 RepID=UPI001C46FF6A|nr:MULTISPECIES: hypothetical protein [unclassified Acidovorax]MBV7428153.1 hypothetical protein [Acidovorax sp. sif0732]MBV7449410.1 hypothetical protein [Acidovorax sp. sif0715]MBV7455884.1 hypothetical protein [Acidovorax sp. sif1233]
MNRCTVPHRVPARNLRHHIVAGLACALVYAALPATAQVQPGLGGMRTFPDAALRGTLTLNTVSEATLNGRTIRMAPGMRLLSPQNTLVMAHTVLGQSYKVNYVIENSTGMLITAWILTQGEAEQPRKGSDTVERNYRAESDPIKK